MRKDDPKITKCFYSFFLWWGGGEGVNGRDATRFKMYVQAPGRFLLFFSFMGGVKEIFVKHAVFEALLNYSVQDLACYLDILGGFS